QCIETNCQNGVDDNLDGGTDCADSSCANQLCGMMPTGTCMGLVCIQPTETVCDDGMDNDGDTLADCLDADCGGRACSDGLSCTTMNVCVGMSCSAGMPVSCTTPPGACFSMMGACQEGANGCVYSPDTNASCSDGLRCTANDACRADGGCEGTPLTCTQSANTCRASTGRCVEADGGCAFDVLADGTSCSDGNTCTVGDTCQGGSCQSGVTTACQPGVCEVVVSANCLADGGCDVRRLDAGTACPGGTCSTSGTCDRFPFVPSNFDPSLVPADAGPALVITCPATFTIISGVISVMSSCSVPTPSQQVIPQDGGMDAILISTPAFRIADAGSLFISGSSHPVIFAVLGDVDIGGALDVSPSSTGTSGPGGNNVVECGAGRGADGGTNASNPRGGGGGGGFGTPGARGGNGENATLLGGAAGTTSGNDGLVPLRGGCAGGNGGGLQGPGLGGRAGGAVQITTTGELRVRGRITASGWGGLGGNADLETAEGPGGGGGGSGGGILLEARRVSVTGRLTANGGGGGSGEAGNGVGTTGTAGFPASINPAPGGVAPGGGGGSGGRGAGRNDPANQGVNGGSQGGGGGGGGGGVGRIRINAIEPCTGSPATVSPQPTSAQNGCQY
ncbi:MAG: hypothetical protein SFW67_05660, partial [Myxococcaceae bacterium]|nr:hypothetical protein [Myxococcaceae bacterium]